MRHWGIRIAVLLGALLGVSAAPRAAEAGMILASESDMALLPQLGSDECASPGDSDAPQSDLDQSDRFATLPSSSSGCGSQSSGFSGSASPNGLLLLVVELPPAPQVARLFLASELFLPNPPPVSLLRPPRTLA